LSCKDGRSHIQRADSKTLILEGALNSLERTHEQSAVLLQFELTKSTWGEGRNHRIKKNEDEERPTL
jgi:hypothetical protein